MRSIKELLSNAFTDDLYGMGLTRGIEISVAAAKRINAAAVAPVVHCCDCKHLSVYNTKDVYAWCRKIGFTFLPFETDTRTHFCGFGERMDGDG